MSDRDGDRGSGRRADAKRNRDAVIDAAVVLLSNRPSASVQEIADASGLGRTTVYRHFQQREDLVRALFERVLIEAHEIINEQMAQSGEVREILRNLGPGLISISERYRFLEAHRDLRTEWLNQGISRDDEPFRMFLADAQRGGDVRGDIPVEWILVLVRSLAASAADEIEGGRLTIEQAGRLVGETLVLVACPPVE